MPLKVIQFAPFSKGKIPSCYRLKQSRFTGIIRTRQHDMAGNIECDFIKAFESGDNNLANHPFASFSDFTTSNSFPRSSITFTAICPCSPASNDALTVPARWSQTLSSCVDFSARFKLSHALVRGKNAWLTWKQSPL